MWPLHPCVCHPQRTPPRTWRLAQANGVSNVFVAKMASEEFSEAMRARERRNRLQGSGMGEWEELSVSTVLVDPPRSG